VDKSMNRVTILAAAALVITVAAIVALAQHPSSAPASAAATPTSLPRTLSQDPAPLSTASAPLASMPMTVLGDWHADHVAIAGVTGPQLVRLSLNWDGGMDGWIQLDGDGNGRRALDFVSLQAADGQLHVRADGGAGCSTGEEGRYSWVRSADGLFLTLKVIDDACATRAAAFARTWVHSLTAVTDGGLGVVPDNDRWIEITMPDQRFGASGFGTDASWLHPMSDTDPQRYLMLIADPLGFDTPCGTTRQTVPFAHTPKALEQYLGSVPGVAVKATDATIDGLTGRRIDVRLDNRHSCAAGDLRLFHSRVAGETDADWTMAPGEAIYLWATVIDGQLRVFGFGGDGVSASDGHSVIDGLKFVDTLPSP
jgi:hypothetical protein